VFISIFVKIVRLLAETTVLKYLDNLVLYNKLTIMEHQTLLSYLLNHYNQLTSNLNKATSPDNTEAIHDIRVSIKRLNALFKYLSFANQAEMKSPDRKLRHLFKASGKLRDAQVQQQLLATYEQSTQRKFVRLHTYILRVELYSEFEFIIELNKTNKRKLNTFLDNAQTFLKKAVILEIETSAIQFIHKTFHDIDLLLPLYNDDAAIHNIRKLVKTIVYILEINAITSKEDLLRVPLKKIKKLGEMLGHWHDLAVMLQFLRQYEIECKRSGLTKRKKYNDLYHLVEKDKIVLFDKFDQKYKLLVSKIRH